MKGRFITTSIKLAVLAGKRKKNVVNIRRSEEVKETKALLQAHELLWSKYHTSQQAVIAGRYR